MLYGMFLIGFGVVLLVLHKPFVEYTKKFQADVFKYHYSDSETKLSKIFVVIMGIGLMAYGLYRLFVQ